VAERRGRELGLVAVLALAGAGLVALAAALTWWSADYVDALTGPLTIAVSGATAVPELVPLALVGLAGFGAALATRGVLRRTVGAVITLCGLVIAIRSVLLFSVPPAALVGDLTRPADPVGSPVLHPLGPVLGLLGGLSLAAAGVLVVLGVGARQRLGSRYDSPSRGAAATTVVGAPGAAAVVETADWWKVLDAGVDPTDQPTGSSTVSDDTPGGGYHDPNASRRT
jgi:uncharacterized membrane protein (TIGR02234 family)